MKRIAMVSFEGPRNFCGGSGKFINSFLEGVNGKVTLFTANRKDLRYFNYRDSIKYIKIPKIIRNHGFVSKLYFINKIRKIKFNEFDHIIVNDNLLKFIKPLSKKILIFRHPAHKDIPISVIDRVTNKFEILMEKSSLKSADLIICFSSITYGYLINMHQKSKVAKIKPGVNIKKYFPKKSLKKKYILCIPTRAEKRKRLDLFFSSLNLFYKNVSDDVKIVLICKADPKLIKKINKLNLSKNIILKTFVKESELIELYQNSLFTVIPSSFEGFSFVALESLLCGTPIVGTDTGALKELIKNKRGVLCKKNRISLFEGMLYAYKKSEELRDNIMKDLNSLQKSYNCSQMAEGILKSIKSA